MTADRKASFRDELMAVFQDPKVRILAHRYARDPDLAEDALQETFCAVAQTQNFEAIVDLRAFFCKSLIHTIKHEFSRLRAVPVEDFAAIADSQGVGPPGPVTLGTVASEAHLHILAEAAFTRLDRDRAELMTMIPARSDDPRRYRQVILEAAERILRLLFEGPVTTADWNAVLRSEYPQWCDEPGLAHQTLYLRLSRARADVQQLLRAALPRQALLSWQGDDLSYSDAGLTCTLQTPLQVIDPQDERARTTGDAVLTALFLKAEQTILPDETPYNLEQELQIFTRWLDRQP